MVSMVCEMVVGTRLLRALEDREPLERPGSYKRQKWLARISFALGMLYAVSGLLSPFIESPWSAYDGDGRDNLKAGAVYVDLRKLDGAAEEETYFFGCKTKVHELAPRMWFIEQYTDAPQEEQSSAVTEYYHLLLGELVPQLEKELMDRSNTEMFWVDAEGLDGLWWGERTGRDGRVNQVVIAALDRDVLRLQYHGPTDLRTRSDYFIQVMLEARED